jgi:hypothetical protein
MKKRSLELEIDPNERWVKCSTLCHYLDISDDTVTRRAIPWQDDHVPYKFRWKEFPLDEDKEPEKRYYFPDGLAFLRNPPPAHRPQLLGVKPAFHV